MFVQTPSLKCPPKSGREVVIYYIPKENRRTVRMSGQNGQAPAEILSANNITALFDSVDAFLFDCDGLLYMPFFYLLHCYYCFF